MKRFRFLIVLMMIIFGALSDILIAHGDTSTPTPAAQSSRPVITLANASRLTVLGTPRPHNIRFAAWSPNGKVLAVADDSAIWLIDANDLSAPPLHKLQGQTDPYSFAFSPDGTLLAVGYKSMTVLWDVATGTRKQTLQAFMSDALAFSPDGSLLVSGSYQGTIRLWSVANGQSLALLGSSPFRVNSLAFNADGSRLASGAYGDLRIWDVQKRVLAVILDSASKPFDEIDEYTHVAFLDDLLVSVGVRAGVQFRSVLHDFASSPVSLSNKPVLAAAYALSTDGNLAAVIDTDGTLSVWEPPSYHAVQRTIVGKLPSPYALAISPDNGTLAVVSGGHLQFWGTYNGKLGATLPEVAVVDADYFTFSPDGRSFATISKTPSITVWDAASLTVKATLNMAGCAAMHFSPDSRLLAAHCTTIHIWDVRQHTQINNLLQNDVTVFGFSADNANLITLDSHFRVRTWAVKSNRVTTSPPSFEVVQSSYPIEVTISDDGQWIAFSNRGYERAVKQITIWKLIDGTPIVTLNRVNAAADPKNRLDISQGVSSTVFSPDKSLLAISSYNTIELWDTRTGNLRTTVKFDQYANQTVVGTLAFSPDGTLLATTGRGKSIVVWNVQTAHAVVVLQPESVDFESDSESYLTFSADGSLLISRDGSHVQYWTVQ